MTCLDVLKAILTRLIFTAHGFIAIWRVTDVKRDPIWWYLAGTLLGLLFESLYTLLERRGQEFKWFCPSVMLYLCTVVPAIWLLELDRLEKRIKVLQGINFTFAQNEELSAIETFGIEIKIPIQLSSEHWTSALEQILLFILIIGRWMLPKGELTRDQLSQLLLVYIGTAADIIEFFEAFKEEEVRYNRILCIIILSIWTWSLLQFTLVLTATKGRKTRMGGLLYKDYDSSHSYSCCTVATWGIMTNILLQDGPFLTLRLILIVKYGVISYMNIFFTSKNTLVIMLQLYRLTVVYLENKKDKNYQPEVESVIISNNMGSHALRNLNTNKSLGSHQSLLTVDGETPHRQAEIVTKISKPLEEKLPLKKIKKSHRSKHKHRRPEYWPAFWDQASLMRDIQQIQSKQTSNFQNSKNRKKSQIDEGDNSDDDSTQSDFNFRRTVSDSEYPSTHPLRWHPLMDFHFPTSSHSSLSRGFLNPYLECTNYLPHRNCPLSSFPYYPPSFDPRFAYYGFVAPIPSPIPNSHAPSTQHNFDNTENSFLPGSIPMPENMNQNFAHQETWDQNQQKLSTIIQAQSPQQIKMPTFYDPRGKSTTVNANKIISEDNQQHNLTNLSEILAELTNEASIPKYIPESSAANISTDENINKHYITKSESVSSPPVMLRTSLKHLSQEKML